MATFSACRLILAASERARGVDHDDAMIAPVLVYSALIFNLGFPDANVK